MNRARGTWLVAFVVFGIAVAVSVVSPFASGGVAANEALVALFRERLQKMNVQVLSPSKSLAVDNAEMMAYLAWLYAGSEGEWLEKSPDFDAEDGLRL